MSKIKSLEELKALRDKVRANTDLRVTGENPDRIVISIGMSTCGISAGARPVMKALLDEIREKNIENISVVSTGCIGLCYAEPLVEIKEPGKDPIRYGNVTKEMAKEIIDKHILQGILLDNVIVGKEILKNE